MTKHRTVSATSELARAREARRQRSLAFDALPDRSMPKLARLAALVAWKGTAAALVEHLVDEAIAAAEVSR